ncbi:MAG: hypothetical protein OEL57_11615, partial [Trichlorobacter sp.]|uniref:hypothetical protein n=1 Tax=Trichlorobacter sp. TaxID=2911007 RepID=UPI00255D3DEB
EQAMQIACAVAGYTPAQAEILWRNLAKKNPEKVANEKKRFIATAVSKKRTAPDKAAEVFDFLSINVEYGFIKAHAVSWALIAYQSAWLKTNYPEEFVHALVMSGKIHEDWDEEEWP